MPRMQDHTQKKKEDGMGRREDETEEKKKDR